MNMTAEYTRQNHAAAAPTLGIDARLALCAIGMDVVTESHAAEARQAAAEALADARRYKDAPEQPETATKAPEPAHAVRVLRAAARIIDVSGWHQGDMTGPEGGVCLLKAIELAAGPDRHAADDAAAVLLGRIQDRFTDSDGLSVPGWNDRQGRTKEQVLSVLR